MKEARKNLEILEGGPFGACIVREGKVLAVARNTVLKTDATAHAEINAIKKASKKLKTFDLSGCQIYSTTEPCPMCFSAIHWARIDTVVFGTAISDAKMIGFNELAITNETIKRIGRVSVDLYPYFMRVDCKKMFDDWNCLENKKLY
ncbi:MAG: nucleoside deaminase [Candidatus Omnitrophica bacterium]|nr:nucleoside deaminase [Candidatus Omnitrophota bacterium]